MERTVTLVQLGATKRQLRALGTVYEMEESDEMGEVDELVDLDNRGNPRNLAGQWELERLELLEQPCPKMEVLREGAVRPHTEPQYVVGTDYTQEEHREGGAHIEGLRYHDAVLADQLRVNVDQMGPNMDRLCATNMEWLSRHSRYFEEPCNETAPCLEQLGQKIFMNKTKAGAQVEHLHRELGGREAHIEHVTRDLELWSI